MQYCPIKKDASKVLEGGHGDTHRVVRAVKIEEGVGVLAGDDGHLIIGLGGPHVSGKVAQVMWRPFCMYTDELDQAAGMPCSYTSR